MCTDAYHGCVWTAQECYNWCLPSCLSPSPWLSCGSRCWCCLDSKCRSHHLKSEDTPCLFCICWDFRVSKHTGPTYKTNFLTVNILLFFIFTYFLFILFLAYLLSHPFYSCFFSFLVVSYAPLADCYLHTQKNDIQLNIFTLKNYHIMTLGKYRPAVKMRAIVCFVCHHFGKSKPKFELCW